MQPILPEKPWTRRASRLRCVAALLVGLSVLVSLTPAVAQQGPAKPTQAKPDTEVQRKIAARKALKEADVLLKQGKPSAALALYQAAEALFPNAGSKYTIALCHDKLGHTQEAAAAYQAFFDASPPATMASTMAEAKVRLDLLKKTPGKVSIAIEPAGVPMPAFAVDDEPLRPATALPAELSLSPGHHTITAIAEGHEPSSIALDVGFAETRPVTMRLRAVPLEPSPLVVLTPLPPVVPLPPPALRPRSNVPAYVLFGVAGAGVVAGSLLGGIALSAWNDFQSAATPTLTMADKVQHSALGSDITFGVAAAAGITGMVWMVTNRSRVLQVPAGPPRPSEASGFVIPYVGPQGGGAAARFTF